MTAVSLSADTGERESTGSGGATGGAALLSTGSAGAVLWRFGGEGGADGAGPDLRLPRGGMGAS